MSTRAEAIVGGSPDDTHESVLSIRLNGVDLCSGVLVAPTLVLTAGHCTWGREPTDLVVQVGHDATLPEATIAVSTIVLYPGATSTADDFKGGVDLAALVLATPVAVEPMAIRDDVPVELRHQEVTLVGFGRTDAFDGASATTRHSVVVPVSYACSRTIETGDDTKNSCEGDSGGAVLLDGALLAIISAGRSGCNTPGVQTRLDAHRVWIASLLAGPIDAPCTTCVSPDSACDALTETGAAGASGTGAGGAVGTGGASASDGANDDRGRLSLEGGCSIHGRGTTCAAWEAMGAWVLLSTALRWRRERGLSSRGPRGAARVCKDRGDSA